MTEISTNITRFDAYKYRLNRAYRSNSGSFGSYSLFREVNGVTQTLNMGKEVNGTAINRIEKYKIEYQKKNGSKWYACSETGEYGYDHNNPKISFSLVDADTGAYIQSDSDVHSYHGYKDKYKVKINCTDSTSPVTLKVNDDVKSIPNYQSKTSRGSKSYEGLCQDKAYNKDTETNSYRVLEYGTSCDNCGWKEQVCAEWNYSYSYSWSEPELACNYQFPETPGASCSSSHYPSTKYVRKNLNCYNKYTCVETKTPTTCKEYKCSKGKSCWW